MTDSTPERPSSGPDTDPGPGGGPPGGGPPGGGPPGGGPPGGGIFTLEDKPAPGLYLAAWVLAVIGLVLFLVIAPLASDPTAGTILLLVGTVVLVLALATACGYQILARRERDPSAYRGPSPLLVFGVYFFSVALVGFLVAATDAFEATAVGGFFVIAVLQSVAYGAVVWLLVVRPGALTWPQMGWPTWRGPGQSALRVIGTAIAVMLPVTFGLLILGSLLAALIGVEAPSVLPAPESSTEALFIALAAALFVPIGEELFYRGFVLTAWLRDLGEQSALLRSATFFALVHVANISTDTFAEGAAQALLQTAIILPVGLVLGWLFLRYGLLAAITGHVTYNGLLLFLAALASGLPEPT